MKHKASVSIEAALVVPFVFVTIVVVYTLMSYLHMDYQISKAATEAVTDFSYDSYLLNYFDISELFAHHGYQRQSLKPKDILNLEAKVGKFGENHISFEKIPDQKMYGDFKELADLSGKMLEKIQKIPEEAPGIAKNEATIFVSRMAFDWYFKNKMAKSLAGISGFKKERLNILAGRYLYDFKASIIYVSYQYEFPIKLWFMKDAEIIQPIYMESFVGNIKRYGGEKYKQKEKKDDKEEESDSEDKIVYMVNLKTYHTLKECHHVFPKPKAYSKQKLLAEGGKYRECTVCKNSKKVFAGTVYKTELSSIYHADLDCGAISRDVMEKKLSEVIDTANQCKHCINKERREKASQ